MAREHDMPVCTAQHPEPLRTLAARGQQRRYRKGSILIHEGDVGDTLFIVLDGRVKVYCTDSHGREITFGVFGAGEYFGEMALTSAAPRTATVSASAPTTLLQLAGEDFQELTQVSSGMKQALERASSRRALINRRRASNV